MIINYLTNLCINKDSDNFTIGHMEVISDQN